MFKRFAFLTIVFSFLIISCGGGSDGGGGSEAIQDLGDFKVG